MNNLKSLSNILFIDIETAGVVKSFDDLSPSMKKQWSLRADRIRRFEASMSQIPDEELFLLKAGIYSEFGRVVCISCGYLEFVDDSCLRMITKSFAMPSEQTMLKTFFDMVQMSFDNRRFTHFCGHNIREFDIPFLCRRGLIQSLVLPEIIDVGGMRPWQVPQLIDTLDLWKFGDYKYFGSLDLMCSIFNISSPKDSMDGSSVHISYWHGQKLNEIVEYCNNDILATAKIFLKLKAYHNIDVCTLSAVEHSQV